MTNPSRLLGRTRREDGTALRRMFASVVATVVWLQVAGVLIGGHRWLGTLVAFLGALAVEIASIRAWRRGNATILHDVAGLLGVLAIGFGTDSGTALVLPLVAWVWTRMLLPTSGIRVAVLLAASLLIKIVGTLFIGDWVSLAPIARISLIVVVIGVSGALQLLSRTLLFRTIVLRASDAVRETTNDLAGVESVNDAIDMACAGARRVVRDAATVSWVPDITAATAGDACTRVEIPLATGHAALLVSGQRMTATERDAVQMIGQALQMALDRIQMLSDLRRQALHDSLTGLANRLFLSERLELALRQRDRAVRPVALCLIDLDDFKSVNDGLGHNAGDGLLVEVGARLTAAVRAGDLVARLGGDEFAVVLDDLESVAAAEVIAERILQCARGVVTLEGSIEVPVSLSVGVSINDGQDETAEAMVRRADQAMYVAKSKGKGRWIIAGSPEEAEERPSRLQVALDLRKAVDDPDGQLVLHYQPLVGPDGGGLVGAEALVRWRHPTRGLIPPLEFIPLAEETGLVVPMGRWVLHEACRQARDWQIKHPAVERFEVAVNVSRRQLYEEGFPLTVASVLKEVGLEPSRLVLEITETTVGDDVRTLTGTLTELKRLGVRLALDDFGTGQSSLSQLQQLPFDIVKIDKSFIDRITEGRRGREVVEAIVRLSRALSLATVAEGVETEAQARTLSALHIPMAQGFHYSRPLPAAEFEALLERAVAA